MNDQEIQHRIEQLIADEEGLRAKPLHTDADRERIAQIEVELDRAWDLLRQRRARKEFGQDPDETAERPARIVENYQQ
jgi:hypothetical protein